LIAVGIVTAARVYRSPSDTRKPGVSVVSRGLLRSPGGREG
jgi:hypothetical protein